MLKTFRFTLGDDAPSSHCSGYEVAMDFRKTGLFCRDDVGIVPYN